MISDSCEDDGGGDSSSSSRSDADVGAAPTLGAKETRTAAPQRLPLCATALACPGRGEYSSDTSPPLLLARLKMGTGQVGIRTIRQYEEWEQQQQQQVSQGSRDYGAARCSLFVAVTGAVWASECATAVAQ